MGPTGWGRTCILGADRPVLPLVGCDPEQVFPFSQPQFPPQQEGEGTSSSFAGLLRELNWTMRAKHTAQILTQSEVLIDARYYLLLATGYDRYGDSICTPHPPAVSGTQMCA